MRKSSTTSCWSIMPPSLSRSQPPPTHRVVSRAPRRRLSATLPPKHGPPPQGQETERRKREEREGRLLCSGLGLGLIYFYHFSRCNTWSCTGHYLVEWWETFSIWLWPTVKHQHGLLSIDRPMLYLRTYSNPLFDVNINFMDQLMDDKL
jgi:hypothetical protein